MKVLYFISITLITSLPLAGRDATWEPTLYPDANTYAPSPLPDRIVLTWNGDPCTTQAVTWRTDKTVSHGCAELAIANESGRDLQPDRFEATTTSLTSDLNEANYHTVTFTGLAPDTLYAYHVGDGLNWSEYFHFRTASKEPKSFSFIYFGDAQNDLKTHWSRVFREAFRAAPRAAFTLHAGDLINHQISDKDWGEWFGAAGWINGTIPVIATPGNHEYHRADGGPESRQHEAALLLLNSNWRPQFAFPVQDPPAGLEETCYYIDYQGTRIISLDSNWEREAQVAWLENVLKNNPQRWTIITSHYPIFSPGAKRDNPGLRELWKPVFDAYKVDLVLNGHDHSYARTGVLPEDVEAVNLPSGYKEAYDPEIGTVYVVSVSGPKLYGFDPAKEGYAVRVAENTQLYQVIEVDYYELRYKAYTATGRLYDAFVLKKRSNQPDLLQELLPPENRRPH